MLVEEYLSISELRNSDDLLLSFIKEENSFINKLFNIDNIDESEDINAYIEELKEEFSNFIKKISGSYYSHINYYYKLLSYFAIIRCKYYFVIPHLLEVLYKHFPTLIDTDKKYNYQLIFDDLIPKQFNERNLQIKDFPLVDPSIYFDFKNNGEFLLYIYNDDINSFLDYTVSHPNFYIHDIIFCSPKLSMFFIIPTMDQSDQNLPYLSEVSISLLEISCCFASIKCFNYFMLNDCYVSSLAYNYAIAGGSLDIIRKLDQIGAHYKNDISCFMTSIYYHRIELTDWIIYDNNKLKIGLSELQNMTTFCNYEASLFFIYSFMRNEQKPMEFNDLLKLLLDISYEIDNLEMFKYLFTFVDGKEVFSLFQEASKQDSLNIVKYLIEGKIIVINEEKYKDIINDTYKKNGLTVLTYLIDVYTNHGSEEDKVSQFNDLYIDLVEKNHVDTLRYLINEIKINTKHFIHHAKHRNMAKFLIEEVGIDPEERDESMKTLLHIACDKKYFKVIQYLIEEVGVDPWVTDSKGMTPFLYAIKSRNLIFEDIDSKEALEIIEYFIKQVGVDLYEKDSYGRYLISYVFQYGNVDVVEYFIKKVGLDPEQIDDNGKFPFQYSTLTNLRLLFQKHVFLIENRILIKTCFSNIMLDSKGSLIKRVSRYDDYFDDDDYDRMFNSFIYCQSCEYDYEFEFHRDEILE